MLNDLFDGIVSNIKHYLANTYTTLPAIITDVSKLESDNVVSVQPAIGTELTDGTQYDLPIIPDLTVQWPAGGGAILSFPLQVGDDVLIQFSMKSLGDWENSTDGTVKQQAQSKTHCLADGIVIPSIFRNANNPSPNPTDVQLKFNGGSIKITDGGNIKVDTAGTFSVSNPSVELIAKLVEILESINSDTVNTVYGTSPLNSSVATQALIDELATLQE